MSGAADNAHPTATPEGSPRQAHGAPPRLERIAFKTSRLLDFTSKRELTAQIGHDPFVWPLVVVKELVDNALDACEEAETPPEIRIEITSTPGEAAIAVSDNGPGIAAETVVGILDYSVRVSSREAYVSPTRGAQGNALKTIIAMPYALDGSRGETRIESRGTLHRIAFAADVVAQHPKIERYSAPAIGKNRTSVTVCWPATACLYLTGLRDRFLQMANEYACLNPHLTLRFDWDGERLVDRAASDPAWSKWRACDPTCPHWYTPERLARYAAALVNHDRERGARERPVREFLAEFRGLSGSTKQREVLEASGLTRQPLAALFKDGAADHARIATLQAAMCAATRAVKPRDLGIIGEEHWRQCCATFGIDQASLRYRCVVKEDEAGMPYVLEAVFAARPERRQRVILSGVNFTPALGNPFREFSRYDGQYDGLEGLLADHYCGNRAPTVVGLHLARPGVQFRDRDKTALVLPSTVATSLRDAVETVTRDWAKMCKAQERTDQRERRELLKPKQPLDPAPAKNAVVGSGVLYSEIAAAAKTKNCSVNDLTVLAPQNDPYRFDTIEGHQVGKWFADQVARFLGTDGRVHLRGLFYRLVAAANVVKPDGEGFANTDGNWQWLTSRASKAARWLGYVAFDRLRDERNEPPRLFLPEMRPCAGAGGMDHGISLILPGLMRSPRVSRRVRPAAGNLIASS
jgi:hypothetical protein